MRSEGRFKDSLREDDELGSEDENEAKAKAKMTATGGVRRSKHLGNKVGLDPNRKNSMNTT